MRKLITAASIILIFIALYSLLRTIFDSHPVKPSPTAVTTTPTGTPGLVVVSTPAAADPTPGSTLTPTTISTLTQEPLQTRVIKHQPDQFRKGALSNEELSAINKAITNIPWSRNSNPQGAANEDYAAIVKECQNSGVHDLLTDLITEAVSNDYQLNNEAANLAYATQLNSDFERGDQSDSPTAKSSGEMTAGQVTSVESGLTPPQSPPDVQAEAVSSSPAPRPMAAEVIRSKTGHRRHRSIVRHKITDVRTQLIALWHQSLAPIGKSP